MKLTPTQIEAARRHLRAADPVMKTIIDAVGPYTLRFERDRFAILIRSIISQQVSTSAARSIRKRLQELAGTEGLTELPDKATSYAVAAPWSAVLGGASSHSTVNPTTCTK